MDCCFSLHRLHQVRRQEGVSRRTVARHLGITTAEVRRQECESTDLPLSALRRWAAALGVPVAELLQEPDISLSPPLQWRARLVRLMKTAKALLEQAREPSTDRLAIGLIEQLVDIMPELREVQAWHAVGVRRRCDEYGRTFLNRLSARDFLDVEDAP